MYNKSHAAVLRICQEEAEKRGYNGTDVTSYTFNFADLDDQRVMVKLHGGHSFSFPIDRLRQDTQFMAAAEESVNLKDEN